MKKYQLRESLPIPGWDKGLEIPVRECHSDIRGWENYFIVGVPDGSPNLRLDSETFNELFEDVL